ncbi:MAG: exodeoxyribonuclease III [Termitinemataceae bacterium]|nr:MAG: exodeoxyribonuclease III [Termitinemataceae bacterium]
MKIISWNVNGVRSVTEKGFLEWLKTNSPDILCIQETKAHPEQLVKEIINPLDKDNNVYKTFWASAVKKGYSGAAIFSKEEPLDVHNMGIKEFDDEGRVLIAFYKRFVLINAYFPNSQEAGARLPYKLRFCNAILEKCNALVKEGKHIILCGDYNIAHNPIDLARPKENEGNAGYLPEERAWMDEWIASGYIDTFRHFYPEQAAAYSWWSYRAASRARNVGWRLDYFCVDSGAVNFIKDSKIRPEVLGSDHCPVEIIYE